MPIINMVYKKKKTRLPQEYQEVEYIQSSGTQVINTGVYPTSQTYTAELEIESLENGQEYWAFGIRGSTGFRAGQDSSGHWDTSYGASYSPSSYALNTKTKVTVSNSGKGTSSSTALGLFGMGENGAYPDNRKGAYKMYYCNIWNSGNLIRELIPCYRKSDGVIGMYDLVNGVFYTNSGSGTFTKGANVNNPLNTPRDIENWTLIQTSTISGTRYNGISMNLDGTKMYLSKGDYIYQYSLTTPYDISSYTQVSSLNVRACEDIYIKSDGTKLFAISYKGSGSENNQIRQYSLSTPRDLSTATQDTYVNTTQEGLRGIAFNNDGTEIIVGTKSNVTIYATLSTAWDLSTVGAWSSVNFGGVSCAFGKGGKMYVAQRDDAASVITYNGLSTAYDLTSVTSTNTKDVGTNRALGMWFNDKGTMCILVGGGSGTNYITKYRL